MARHRILDIRAALAERIFPTVTLWNRVEGRPRTIDFGRALRADVRDALWMLSRQWQLGEFEAEDAGSPVTATYHVTTTRPTRFAPADGPPSDLPDGEVLEAVAERLPVPFTVGDDPISFDLRLALGRRWLKLINPSLRPAFVARYPIDAPDPAAERDTTLVAHDEVWATLQAAAGRLMDGFALYRHLEEGGRAHDGIPDLTEAQRNALDATAERFVAFFDDLIAQPDGPGAWDPSRLEHNFAVAAPSASGEHILAAREYPGGRLDWHSFSVDPESAALGATDQSARGSITRTVIPGAVRYPGMPHARWWAFEDGRTNFGAVTPDSTDLVRLLFLEFALVFGNDWFLAPCDLEPSTVAGVNGLAVTDVFGQRSWITPAGSRPEDDWQEWAMYEHDIAGSAPPPAAGGLFLPASTSNVAEGPPLEDVLLVRDESANMVWGIERVVPLATGEGLRGAEAAAETLAHRRRLAPAPSPVEPAAPIAYQAVTTVPENWIPFIPVHVLGDTREIQLQRAALPRVLDGASGPPVKVRPRTTLLRAGLDADPPRPHLVHEEEVSRAGTRATLCFNRARRADGRVVIWLSARRTTGPGEASSGLAFDQLVDTGR